VKVIEGAHAQRWEQLQRERSLATSGRRFSGCASSLDVLEHFMIFVNDRPGARGHRCISKRYSIYQNDISRERGNRCRSN
jgi:hypothetical protein